MKVDGVRTIDTEGVIDIVDVKFNYPSKSDVPVLKGVTINVPNNQIVAIVGASGRLFLTLNSYRLWKIIHN